MTRRVRLDWASDSDADRFGAWTAGQRGLAVETVEASGPGGGWPLLEFEGPDAAIDGLVRAYSHDLADVDGDAYFYDVDLLSFDEAEALGLDGTGRDLDLRFPHRESNLTADEAARLRTIRLEEAAGAARNAIDAWQSEGWLEDSVYERALEILEAGVKALRGD